MIYLIAAVLMVLGILVIVRLGRNSETDDFGPQGVLTDEELDLLGRMDKLLIHGHYGLAKVKYNAFINLMASKYDLNNLQDYIVATLPESNISQVFALTPKGQEVIGGKIYSIFDFHQGPVKYTAIYG